jgi:predicted transposase/invertase (TIGR01784 family)
MKAFFKRSRFSRDLKQLVRENAAQGKPLCIMDDLVFKAMLSSDTEDSREALRSLLSACIRREVSKVMVTNNDLIPAHLDAKASRLDVHVTFDDGEAADLEMQMDKTGDKLATRAAIYSAMLLAGQSRRGKAYGSTKRVYQIFFLNDILFPHSEKLPRRYSYREETEQDRLTDVSEIIFYEMPKMEQGVRDYLEGKTGTETLRNDEKWCIYMKYRHEKRATKLIEELYREEGIMRAEKAVKGISRDYLKFAREMAIAKNRMDLAQEREDGHEEGRAEGHVEGHAEGRAEKTLEIARKMKAIGRPSPEIAEVTGLPTETIEQLPSD